MPKVSEFFGISVYVHFREHQPPHFHALYGDEEAWIAIDNLTVLHGRLSPRAMGLVMEWASLHQDELCRAWDQAIAHGRVDKIAPLR